MALGVLAILLQNVFRSLTRSQSILELRLLITPLEPRAPDLTSFLFPTHPLLLPISRGTGLFLFLLYTVQQRSLTREGVYRGVSPSLSQPGFGPEQAGDRSRTHFIFPFSGVFSS